LKKFLLILLILIVAGSVYGVTAWYRSPRIGHVDDEAKLAGNNAEFFRAAGEDYFKDMDKTAGGADPLAALPPADHAAAVRGRNTWIVWTAGDDRLWDKMTVASFGALDFVKTLSSYPGLKASRDNRWDYLGLVNEPCFVKATGPDPNRFGLWLDKRDPNCPPDPFEDEKKYPGVRYGARGKNIPVGSYYGYATGVVGLRLFPNPDFDEAAQKSWDAERYYKDASYYNDRKLIRPYRVGMSCGFCHVGPNPINPPADRNNPKWENLSSNVGAQYFWIDRIFYWSGDQSNFFYQLFHTSRPGTLDTSLISTDSINNPRSMNAVYQLKARLLEAKRWGREKLAGGEQNNHQINDYLSSGPLADLYARPDTVWTPRVLKDGSDSVGVMGALNRVYLNIGAFSEEWLLHFNALAGGRPISPIEISVARRNSPYFVATEAQTFDVARYFLSTTDPHYLADAPGGNKYLTKDAGQLKRGKQVFAENCARCHSSKLPPGMPGLDEAEGCAGANYTSCWQKYWDKTKTDDFKSQMTAIVMADDFLKDNYLSSELRIPVTLLHTNACSPLATNAIEGNIWGDFSSHSYKELPSAGEITWYQPITGEPRKLTLPAGGRGYTRPPSLVSMWSTAPYLLNNTVGPFVVDPSVEGRMQSFEASIEQMLWPERRDQDLLLGNKVPGRIDRTTQFSEVRIAGGYLPDALRPLLTFGQKFAPGFVGDGEIHIPIPKGTPVSLVSNLNLLAENPAGQIGRSAELLDLVRKIIHDVKALGPNPTDQQMQQAFMNVVEPMLKLSKCPDLVVNRGHYFGTNFLEPAEQNDPQLRANAISDRGPGLSDSDKRALIEFLKTF